MISIVFAAGLSAMTGGLMPPAEYDHAPARTYTVVEMPDAMLRAACRYDGSGDLYGCASTELWTVFLREGMGEREHLLVLRHEQAHLNGWVHE